MVGSSNFTLLIVIQFHGASAWFLCLLMPPPLSLSLSVLHRFNPLPVITLSLCPSRWLYALLSFSPSGFRIIFVRPWGWKTPYRPKIQRGGLDNCLTSSLTILISRQTSLVLDSCTLGGKSFRGSRIAKIRFAP